MPGLKIRKGDTVEVISGKDRGKQGRVVNVYPERNKVMVEGVNQVKRHEPIRQAQGRGGMTGGIITKEMPIQVSNVMVVCPSCDKPTRVGYSIDVSNKERKIKERICRKCGGKI